MTAFLATPGRPGTFGSILDETARAAGDFCNAVEAISLEHYLEEGRPDAGKLASIQGICVHCVTWGYAYSKFIRDVRELGTGTTIRISADQLPDPDSVRPAVAEMLRHTEESVDGLWDAGLAKINSLSFTVSWGPTFNPELILEHGLVHLLRHRRQIEQRLTSMMTSGG